MLRFRREGYCLEASHSTNGVTHAWVINADFMVLGFGRAQGSDRASLSSAVMAAILDAAKFDHPFELTDCELLTEE